MAGRAGKKGGDDSRCPSCSAPVLRQLVGTRAALTVTADLTPLTPTQQAELRTPHRLIWCLKTGPHTAPRLRWIGGSHPPDCPHPHVTDHHCTPAPAPSTLF
ncbi:hypothetical protein ACIQUY_31845 [Streptomyces sp. NPDC090231]|uniref:hypothetical protein n=1 Tax=unclassified Streptomyces TaxID=2593676 RepID=UPI003801796E